MYLPVPGTEPTSSVFLGECVTLWATVANEYKNRSLRLFSSQGNACF